MYHHERIDGKGYYSIPGNEIPLPAKIIAIADAYSAITMRRVYKAPKTHEAAIQLLDEVSGSQVDSELFEIFKTIPKEKLAACVPPNIETGIIL